MTLKRTGLYTRAAAGFLVAAGSLACQAIILVHLIAVGNWRALLSPLLAPALLITSILLFLDVLIVLWPISLVMRERGLRAAAIHDSHLAPPATVQPDPGLALPPGQTLTLARRRARSLWLELPRSIFVLLLFAVFGDIVIIPLLPDVSGWFLNLILPALALPGQSVPPSPSALDWLAIAFPPTCSLGLFIWLIPSELASHSERIKADDVGLTISRSFRRTRFIPWGDIALFIRAVDSLTGAPEGGYFV